MLYQAYQTYADASEPMRFMARTAMACTNMLPGFRQLGFGGKISATLEMISVAEESGRLDQELVRIANVTEGDLYRQLKAAVSMAEPLMLFVVAAIVGVIVIGMVLPIFSLQDQIK